MKWLGVSAMMLILSTLSAIGQGLVADTPVLVKTFPLLPKKEYSPDRDRQEILFFFLQDSSESPTFPFLIHQAGEIGICDYVTKRTLWLNPDFTTKSIKPRGPLGELQLNSTYLKVLDGSVVEVTRGGTQPKIYFVAKLPKNTRPFSGGVWYQSDVLFFWDEVGEVHAIEHPLEAGNDWEVKNRGDSIKNRSEVQRLVLQDKGQKFAGIIWDGKYGLMKDGFPMAKTFNTDWANFLSDQRQKSKTTEDDGHQLVPTAWLNNVDILRATDGTLYFGGGLGYWVIREGYVAKTIDFPKGIDWDTKVLPNGDILLAETDFQKQAYRLYLIKKTW